MNPGDTCTPIYGLPYATGQSRPCNIGSTSCDFAAAVEVQLDALDAVVLRTNTTVPIAWIRTTTPFPVTENATQSALIPAPFDTVVVDTDDMVDLVQFSNGVTTTRGGLYLVWIYVRGTATVVTGTDTNIFYQFFIEPSTAVNTMFFPQVRFTQVQLNQFQRQAALTVMNIPAGARFGMNFDPTGAPTDTITFSEIDMGLMWLGEQP